MVLTHLRRFYSSFVANVVGRPLRLLALLLFLLYLLLPVVAILPSWILLMLGMANVMAVYAASWDLLSGFTGQFSFGHVVFFGVGAYTVALAYKYYASPFWITIPLSVPIGFLVALLVGFPALRVKGPYLALLTLALPLLLHSVFLFFKDITKGYIGILVPSLFPDLGFYERRVAEFYFTLIFLFVSGIILYKIANSEKGFIFVSILSDEVASEASGVNVTKYKLMSFAISGSFAALAGAVYVVLVRHVNIEIFGLVLSFNAIVWTMFGGIGTIYGPIVGTLILQIIDRYVLSEIIDVPAEWRVLIYAILVIVVILLLPQGLVKFLGEKLEGLQKRKKPKEREKEKRRAISRLKRLLLKLKP